MARAPKKQAVPAALTQEFASIGGDRDITRPFVHDLHEPRDPKLWQSAGWGQYDIILNDPRVKFGMDQRIRAVVQAEWNVIPGDPEDPRSVESAERFKATCKRIMIDALTENILWATFYGYAVAEFIWGVVDDKPDFLRVSTRHARRFRYDKEMQLVMLTNSKPRGEVVPDLKFWVLRSGANNDDEPYGKGLAEWLYWPVTFKRNTIAEWHRFLKKFATPTRVASHRSSDKAEIDRVTAMLHATMNGSTIAIPDRFTVKLLETARGTADYKDMIKMCQSEITQLILSQTMTTDDGSSNSQAQVHADVKLDLVRADSDLFSESFNAGPVKWWHEMNFGPDVSAPIFMRRVEEEADLKAMAETDAIHADNGWVRSDESFKEVYGDGYVMKAEVDKTDDEKVPKAPSKTPISLAAPQSDVINSDVDAIMSGDAFIQATKALSADLLDALSAAKSIDEINAILDGGIALMNDAPITDALLKAKRGEVVRGLVYDA